MPPTSNKRLSFSVSGAAGYSRKCVEDEWAYLNERGKTVRSANVIGRLNALALPPAYHDAWFARDPNAHIQATGIDEKGRKQYRYHSEFIAAREAAKYDGCAGFGRALPKIRARVAQDIARRDLSRERVVAAIVRLLDLGSVRIGNQSYAKANSTFGATTLRNQHAHIRGARLMLDFIGKSGKPHSISIADARLIRTIRHCQELPGQSLFQFCGDDGHPREITSADVNAYLCTHSGKFTAKHFRTWAASVLAFEYLTLAKDQPKLKDMLDLVSEKLGNTPAIARKSYVHPALIAAIQDGSVNAAKLPRPTQLLSRYERGLITYLEALAAQTDDF